MSEKWSDRLYFAVAFLGPVSGLLAVFLFVLTPFPNLVLAFLVPMFAAISITTFTVTPKILVDVYKNGIHNDKWRKNTWEKYHKN